MFIPNDDITEIVAHFVGYFHIRAEDARYRSEYVEFARQQERLPDDHEIDPHQMEFRESLNTGSSTPSVHYTPPGYAFASVPLVHSVSFDPINLPMGQSEAAAPQTFVSATPSSASMATPEMQFQPGSTIAIVSQIQYLMDDDVVVVGDYEFEPGLRLASHAELDGLTAQAMAVSADLAELNDLRSVTQMTDLVEGASAIAHKLSQDDFGPLDSLFLKLTDRIEGHFANGIEVDAAVTLEDMLAQRAQEDDEASPDPVDVSTPESSSLTIDAATTPTTMTVSSGGNLSWNETTIVNAGLPSGAVAIAGNYHRIDAIFQTNVLRDIDTIDEAWPAENITIGGNVVQNSASFINESHETRTGETPGGDGGFPQNWNVTSVEGDMTFLSWVQQYSFTSDHDTQILTAVGTYTSISSGLNMGFNTMSFADLGAYFDLIIIGGSLYDGNFITQTNVLLDSDRLSVLGVSSAWQGNAATGENILWNEASIENIGPGNWSQGLPSHYRDAAERLAAGDKSMPDGFRTDATLDGFGNLNVLYIAGNVYDTHSISQTNVVGDADDLSIYEASLLKAQDSVWQVATGHNMLVNKAKIIDYDSLGQVAHVGGEIYSDAILVQADIVQGLTERLTVRGDQLANEVIAFLDNHTDIASRLDDHPTLGTMSDAGVSYDVMHSVLA